MKKLCLSLLCLCLVVACIILLPTPAYAVTEGDYTYEVSNGGATILAVNYKISGDVVIPATLGGYPVRMIGDRAFSGCNSMTSVVIPEGVTRIGNEAFYSCYNLTSISIPESLISIGNGVFSSCNSLTYATYDGARYLGNEDNPYLVLMGADAKTRSIADTTKLLYDSAFANRKELDNLSIPDSVIYVGSSCFYGCDSLTYATYDGAQYLGNAENPYMILVEASAETRSIADTTKIICGSAFQDSKGLTAITVPEGVVGIGVNAFSGCTNLESISLPSTVAYIGRYAFGSYLGIDNVYIADLTAWCNVHLADRYASPFLGVKNVYIGGELVTALEIPNGIEFINNCAFYGLDTITAVKLPDSIVGVGEDAFAECDLIVSVTLGKNLQYISTGAFSNCRSLERVAFPNGLLSIGDYAFEGCAKLSSVYLPESLIHLGECAFTYCPSLKDAYVQGTGIALSATFSDCSSLTSVTLKEGISEILSSAFEGCKALQEIVIPEGVTKIGIYSFESCSALTKVSIPGSVSIIEAYAFRGCSNLTDIVIPEGVKKIEKQAFENCYSLTNVSMPNSLESIGSDMFSGCSYLVYNIYDNGKYLGNTQNPYVILVRAATTTTNLANTTKFIYNGAFKFNTTLTKLTIPQSVLGIGADAFNGCTALSTIDIPYSVTQIGEGAFYNCDSLTVITVPGSVGYIPVRMFAYCNNLSSVTFGNGIFRINDEAFRNCTSLTKVVFPATLTRIEADAFTGCTKLKDVYYVGSREQENILYSALDNEELYAATWTYDWPEEVPSYFRYTTSGSDMTITDYTGTDEVVTIGKVYSANGTKYTVTKIGYGVFSGNKTIKRVILPDSLVSIGSYAFSGCTGLTEIGPAGSSASIVLPDSLTTIGSNAFENCTGLKTVNLGNSVTSISSGAFRNCTGLKTVNLGNGVTSINSGAFRNCTALEEFTMPNGILSLGNSAFYGCTALTQLHIPESVTSISEGALAGLTNLESLTIPFVGGTRKTSTDTYQYPFGYIFGKDSYTGAVATKQYYHASSTYLSANATYYIPASLKSVTVLGGHIPYGAFYNCSGLETIGFGNGVTGVSGTSFEGCTGLTYLHAADIASWCNIQFKNYDANPLYYTGSLYVNGEPITEVIIPEGTTQIGSYAFYGCNTLSSIEIPASVQHIGMGAFSDCTNLEAATIYGEVDGSAFSGCTSLKTATIYGEVGSSAFAGCTGLETVTIGNSVEYIGNYAFSGCTSLKEVVVPNSVTGLGYNVFKGCTGLQKVKIGSSVPGIPADAFADCTSLKEVVFGASVTSIGADAFQNCSSLTSIDIPYRVTKITEGAFSGCSSLESISLPFIGGSKKTPTDTYQYPFGYIFGTYSYPGGVATQQTYYGANTTSPVQYTYYIPASLKSVTTNAPYLLYGAFSNCTNIESITLDAGVESIAANAFAGCVGLTRLSIGRNVKTIDANAFTGCAIKTMVIPSGITKLEAKLLACKDTLETVIISNSITYIAPDTFAGCDNLKYTVYNGANYIGTETNPYFALISCADKNLAELVVHQDTKLIADSAFADCTNLTYVILPDGILNITGAFRNCKTITEVVIPSSIKTIGDYTFYGCTALKTLTVPGSINSVSYSAFMDCAIEKLIIAEGATTITQVMIVSESTLKEVVIPESVTTIQYRAFQSCTALKEIIVPDTVTKLENGAFYGCSSLESITLPFLDVNMGQLFGTESYSGAVKVEQYASETATRKTVYYIPSGLKYVTVSNGDIPYGAFYNCSGLTNVIIPSNAKTIGVYAFYYCKALKEITIPDSVTELKEYAFYGCVALENLYMGTGVTRVKDEVFSQGPTSGVYIRDLASWCKIDFYDAWANPLSNNKVILYVNGEPLTNLVVPGSITRIGNYAFANYRGLKSLTISDGVAEIGEGAFDYAGLTEATISGSVKTISAAAFLRCDALTDVTIGHGTTTIEINAFYGCKALRNVVLPSTVTSIGDSAFSFCDVLTSITMPGDVEYMGENAFNDCEAIEKLTIADGATVVTKNIVAFTKSKLRELVLPASLRRIDDYAFADFSQITKLKLPLGLESIGDYAFEDCYNLTELTIPDSVISIGSYAFYNSRKIQTITMGGNVESIGQYAFHYCTALEKVHITNLAGWCNISFANAAANPLSGAANPYINNQLVTDLVIPDGVEKIGAYAFAGCTGLKNVTVPESVIRIENAAFTGCSGLESMTLPFVGDSGWTEENQGVTDQFGYIFGTTSYKGGTETYQLPNNASSSNSYYIPSNLKKVTITDVAIPDNAFYGCAMIEEVAFTDALFSIGDKAFMECTALRGCTGYDNVTQIGAYAFYYCRELQSIVIPDGLTVIEEYTFYNCDGMFAIRSNRGRNLKVIGDHAFAECGALSILELSDTLTEIGNYAFAYCDSLNDVSFGNSLSYIGASAFEGCISYGNIYVPASVKHIGANAFAKGEVSRAVVVDDVAAWCAIDFGNEYANPLREGGAFFVSFADDSANLVIPDGTKEIKAYAFIGCDNIQTVTIPSSLEKIHKKAFYNCSALNAVTMHNSGLKMIDSDAFGGCDKLKSVSISDVAAWCETTFYNIYANPLYYAKSLCVNEEQLTALEIPEGVKYIRPYAFYTCRGIKTITIPDSATEIGERAFDSCNDLESVTIGKTDTESIDQGRGITSIGRYAFVNCKSLKEITISNSVAQIGEYAFYNCNSVDRVTIGENVETIGNYAFANCGSLKEITIPDSVVSIGQYVFSGCSGLESVTIPFIGSGRKSETSTYQYPFGYLFGTTSYTGSTSTKQYYYGSSTSSTTYSYYYIPASLKTVEITEGKILYGAFYNCIGLTEVRIGNEVESIGNSAFYGCSGIEKVYYLGTEEQKAQMPIGSSNDPLVNAEWFYVLPDGFTYTLEGTDMTITGYAGPDAEAVIKSTYEVNGVTYVVTGIGSYAFKERCDLTGIVIPDTVKTIDEGAFYGCDGLTHITIPASVTTIGDLAFYSCTGLSIDSANQHFSIDEHGVLFNKDKTELLQVPASYSGSYTVPEGVTKIGKYAFYGCANVEKIILPGSVSAFEEGAFTGCTGLKEVHIDDLAAWCGANFDTADANPLCQAGKLYVNNELLTELEIPAGVTAIGENAFYQYDSLTAVHIPAGVTNIGDGAFYGCSGLTEIVLPEGVTEIGNSAFENCTQLKTLTIPQSVTKICEGAFSGCANIETVFYFGTEEQKEQIFFGEADTSLQNATWKNVKKTEDGSLLVRPDGTNITVSGYTGTETDVFIAPNYTIDDQEYTTVGIDTGAFKDNDIMTTLTIPKTVTVVGAAAYAGCSKLEVVAIAADTQITQLIPYAVRRALHATSVESEAFRDCKALKTVIIGEGVYSIGEDAFAGCTAIEKVLYEGSKEQWQEIVIAQGNDNLLNAEITYRYGKVLAGDLDGVEGVTDADAVYLLYHTFLPGLYPVDQECDFNGDGEVNDADAVHLLYYTFLPDLYPLH